MKFISADGILYMTFDCYQGQGVVAAVSCRTGGVSEPPFSSLNMGFHTGDDADAVRENRRRYFEALGLSASRLVSGNQVHGTYIYKVTEKDAGRGALTMETAIPACDGFMTDEKDIPITMNYADCTPLFFYDPVKRAIALSHGGWRGTAGNIAALTVAKMEKNYGSKRKDILCVIGPAIGLECFEVGEEVVEEFYKLFNEKEISRLAVKKANGKYLFDLHNANRRLLEKAGIPADHIEDCGLCTYCHDDLFYSYRRSGGKTGRHMAVMALV